MADLASLLLALGISGEMHPWGHVATEGQYAPVSIDWKHGVENWNPSTNIDPRHKTEGYAAGFNIQDKIAQGLQGNDLELSMRLANALFKLGYLGGVKPSQTLGDPALIEQSSGNKYTKSLLGASALFDLWKSQNPQSNFDLSFITPNGSPGLLGTLHF